MTEIAGNTDLIQYFSDQVSRTTAAYLKDKGNATARVAARTAARNLHIALQEDDEGLFFLVEQHMASVVLRLLSHLKAHTVVPVKQSDAISADDLAAKLECEPELITRLMRHAVAAGLYDEPRQDHYAHNPASASLLDPAHEAFFEVINDEFLHGAWGKMTEWFDKFPKRSPNDIAHHPYGYSCGMDGKHWIECAMRTPEILARVSTYFSGKFANMPTLDIYPWADIHPSPPSSTASDVFLVDIGGHLGQELVDIQHAYPHLRDAKMVLQDLPPIIAKLPPLPANITPMAHDFWTPQPVKHARVYYLRRILHDWPDAAATQLLTHTAAAMGPDSRVLATDLVVPDRVQRDDTTVYLNDMVMFTFSGKERTRAQWERLFDDSGLEITKIWMNPGDLTGVVEGRLKR